MTTARGAGFMAGKDGGVCNRGELLSRSVSDFGGQALGAKHSELMRLCVRRMGLEI
jgi:hypothetical protein